MIVSKFPSSNDGSATWAKTGFLLAHYLTISFLHFEPPVLSSYMAVIERFSLLLCTIRNLTCILVIAIKKFYLIELSRKDPV